MMQTVHYAFLHGGGQGSWVWEQTIAALRSQESLLDKVLALDVPGCGIKRGRPIADLTPHDVAIELISDLEQAGMKDVVLTGHSLAGNVLPALEELRPQLFRRLVYLSCSIPLEGQTVLRMMGSGAHGSNVDEVGWPSAERADQIRHRYEQLFCGDMGEEQRDSFLNKLDRDEWPHRFFSNTRFTFPHLGQVPATYVFCLQDNVLPMEWQEKFAQRFRVSRRVRIDAGHQAMVTRPHALAEILRYEATH